jgi:hypothetical protein
MINANLTEQRDFSKYFTENVENKPNPSPCERRDIPCLAMKWSSISVIGQYKEFNKTIFHREMLIIGSKYHLNIGQNSKQYNWRI